jgi:hypothetical protein
MRLATSESLLCRQGLSARHSLKMMRERGVRPAVGFSDPLDVLKDPHLTTKQKREILASWASDASAVQDEPKLRWLLGTPEPVPLASVQEALGRLDRLSGAEEIGLIPPASRARVDASQASQGVERGVQP